MNEPSYGNDASYPVEYASIPVRIEFESEKMQFQTSGERVSQQRVYMYVEPQYPILEEDRITVLAADDATLVGQLYIVMTAQPEWNAVGNVHHYICELEIH